MRAAAAGSPDGARAGAWQHPRSLPRSPHSGGEPDRCRLQRGGRRAGGRRWGPTVADPCRAGRRAPTTRRRCRPPTCSTGCRPPSSCSTASGGSATSTPRPSGCWAARGRSCWAAPWRLPGDGRQRLRDGFRAAARTGAPVSFEAACPAGAGRLVRGARLAGARRAGRLLPRRHRPARGAGGRPPGGRPDGAARRGGGRAVRRPGRRVRARPAGPARRPHARRRLHRHRGRPRGPGPRRRLLARRPGAGATLLERYTEIRLDTLPPASPVARALHAGHPGDRVGRPRVLGAACRRARPATCCGAGPGVRRSCCRCPPRSARSASSRSTRTPGRVMTEDDDLETPRQVAAQAGRGDRAGAPAEPAGAAGRGAAAQPAHRPARSSTGRRGRRPVRAGRRGRPGGRRLVRRLPAARRRAGAGDRRRRRARHRGGRRHGPAARPAARHRALQRGRPGRGAARRWTRPSCDMHTDTLATAAVARLERPTATAGTPAALGQRRPPAAALVRARRRR